MSWVELVIRFGLMLGDFKRAWGKLGIVLECYQEGRTLGMSKILLWRQEHSETRDDAGLEGETTQKKELLVIL